MSFYASTTEVQPRHRLDEARLDGHLRAHLPGYRGGLAIRQFDSGHSNPTYLVSADMADGRRDFALRKKPPGTLVKSAHQVDREHRVLSALAASDVPVPRTRLLCEDETVLGQAFYVMDCVPGRIFADVRMPGLAPGERAAIFDSMNDVLARLHRVDPGAIGLADYGRHGRYIERQLGRWTRQYAELRTDDIPEMDKLAAWLPAHIPAEDPTTIAHGDYRLGNLIVHPHEPRIVAVLDWELSTLGHPLCDLAYNCLGYRMGEPPHGFAGADLAALGIPSEADYVAAYCRRTGRVRVEGWTYYLAFSLYRLAAIAQGVYRRGLDGNASSPESVKMGDAARRRAELAWSLVG